MADQHISQVDASTQHARGAHLIIIPTGTQVVSRVEQRDAAGNVTCPVGALGVVVRPPDDATHAYRVRLPDGREVSLKRPELSIRKHVQAEDLDAVGAVLGDHDLYEHVVYRCLVGATPTGWRARRRTPTRAASTCRRRSCTGRCSACRSSSRTR
jgi:hypothetical protein